MNQFETTAFNMLANRQRINNKTDILQFTRIIRNEVPEATEEDTMAFFKSLQDEGKGVLIRGRGDNPTRFIWKYNLKEVAEQALGKRQDASLLDTKAKVLAKPVKAKRGRPVGSKNKTYKMKSGTRTEVQATQAIVFQLPANFSKEDVQALIDLTQAKVSK